MMTRSNAAKPGPDPTLTVAGLVVDATDRAVRAAVEELIEAERHHEVVGGEMVEPCRARGQR